MHEVEVRARDARAQTIRGIGCGADDGQAEEKRRRAGPGTQCDGRIGRGDEHDRLKDSDDQGEKSDDPRHRDRTDAVATHEGKETGEEEPSAEPDGCHAGAARVQEQHVDRGDLAVRKRPGREPGLEQEQAGVKEQFSRPRPKEEYRGEDCKPDAPDHPRGGAAVACDSDDRRADREDQCDHPHDGHAGCQRCEENCRASGPAEGALRPRDADARPHGERQEDCRHCRTDAAGGDCPGHRRQERVGNTRPHSNRRARHDAAQREVDRPACDWHCEEQEHAHREPRLAKQENCKGVDHHEIRGGRHGRSRTYVVPRLRVVGPKVCRTSGARKQCTALEHSVAPPQPPECDEGEKPECGREHCRGSKDEAPDQASPLIGQECGVIVDRPRVERRGRLTSQSARSRHDAGNCLETLSHLPRELRTQVPHNRRRLGRCRLHPLPRAAKTPRMEGHQEDRDDLVASRAKILAKEIGK